MSSRVLTEDERKELVIRLHENTGEWDVDILTSIYSSEELVNWGFSDEDYGSYIEETIEPPEEFGEYGEDVAVDHRCPKCGYEWAGQAAKPVR